MPKLSKVLHHQKRKGLKIHAESIARRQAAALEQAREQEELEQRADRQIIQRALAVSNFLK